MAEFLGTPKFQAFDSVGDPLVGGKVYTYDAGTLTPRATYPTLADAFAATNANENPVTLDARGEATIVVSGATKIVLTTSTGAVIWTTDNYSASTPTVFDSDSNELLKFTTVANAVNEWTITNAAVGNNPRFDATGSDTNVGGYISSKGSDPLYLDGGSTGNLELSSISTGTIKARRALELSSTLTFTDTTKAFNLLPAGTLLDFAGSSTPAGFLLCDGTAINRTTYATLFAAIGTLWGVGDGSTTFNLPDFRRKVAVGSGGTGTGTLAATTGSTGGAETHTLTTAETPAHAHTTNAGGSVAVAAGGSFGVPNFAGGTPSSSSGSGNAHNNMQPSNVVTKIIRAY